MSTKYFKKKIWHGISIFSVLVVFIFCIVAINLSKLERVGQTKIFYFLLSTETNVEVGIEFSKLDGGAGYLLEYAGEEYVALSVYENKEAGEKIQALLQDRGKETLLLQVGGSQIYRCDLNCMRLIESYISVLNQCIVGLEKGMTQESCKRSLKILQRQLTFAVKQYVDIACIQVLKLVDEELFDIIQQDVYAKDLRYVLCMLVDNYTRISAKFI